MKNANLESIWLDVVMRLLSSKSTSVCFQIADDVVREFRQRFSDIKPDSDLLPTTPVHRVDFARSKTRILNVCKLNDIYDLGQLANHTRLELMEMRYFGTACLKEVRRVLSMAGLHLKDEG